MCVSFQPSSPHYLYGLTTPRYHNKMENFCFFLQHFLSNLVDIILSSISKIFQDAVYSMVAKRSVCKHRGQKYVTVVASYIVQRIWA